MPRAYPILVLFLAAALAGRLPAQQPNVAGQALMTFDLQNGPPWPVFPVPLPVGPTPMTHVVELSGPPGAPFIVAGAGSVLGAGVPVRGGLLDLDVASGLAIAANGLQDPVWSLGPTGSFRAAITLAAGTPPGLQRGFQAAVTGPTSPAGATLTAATSVRLVPTVLNQLLNVPSGGSVMIDLAPFGLTVPFYGVNHTQIFVNQDGFVSFTTAVPANPSFVSSPGAFLASVPRIAGYWTDLEPVAGSSISVWIVPGGAVPAHVQVNWIDMREWSATGTPHSFAIRIFAAPVGIIQILEGPANGPPSSQEVLVGLSPGGNLSTAAVHPQKDLSALSPAAPLAGCPNENFHEWFGLLGFPFYTAAFNNPWDLAGRTLTFAPVSWPAGSPSCPGSPAGSGYVAY